MFPKRLYCCESAKTTKEIFYLTLELKQKHFFQENSPFIFLFISFWVGIF